MTRDAFSKYHPLVNFIFFVGAMGFGMLIQHPAYLCAGLVGSGTYYLLLKGRKGLPMLLSMGVLFVFLTAINPLFNTYGATPLFSLFGRPYTYEALLYGAAVAAVFVVMLLWFGCYNIVLTSDKFTSLFGSLIPSLSLLLVMVFRMVPNLLRKVSQISGARRSLGKSAGEGSSVKEKLLEGTTVLSALTSWALEGSIVTGDSMRARGYGAAKRTSFTRYRMDGGNWLLLGLLLGLGAVVIIFSLGGSTAAAYTPQLTVTPVDASNLCGLLAYGLFLLIPTLLHLKEALQWHISRSGI